jgi:hypothetical protein
VGAGRGFEESALQAPVCAATQSPPGPPTRAAAAAARRTSCHRTESAPSAAASWLTLAPASARPSARRLSSSSRAAAAVAVPRQPSAHIWLATARTTGASRPGTAASAAFSASCMAHSRSAAPCAHAASAGDLTTSGRRVRQALMWMALKPSAHSSMTALPGAGVEWEGAHRE